MDRELTNLIAVHLNTPASGFSIGCLGALAEFQDSDSRVAPISGNGAIEACSAHGAMRIDSNNAVSAVAYETLSATADAWQCGVVLVANETATRASGRSVLTELKPDADAIRDANRNDILFDLGVGMRHIDFCVRTSDPSLINDLRRYNGMRVVEAGHPIFERIIASSPHRVVMSAIGRIEVYQDIDRHQTPSGPHTHVLPDLLAKGRTHSTNIPVPSGTLPVLTLHPENPLRDLQGQRKPFSKHAYDHFESILAEHGLPKYVDEKLRLRRAIATGMDPVDYRKPASRIGRLAMRIALRQSLHLPPICADTGAWIRAFRV